MALCSYVIHEEEEDYMSDAIRHCINQRKMLLSTLSTTDTEEAMSKTATASIRSGVVDPRQPWKGSDLEHLSHRRAKLAAFHTGTPHFFRCAETA